MAKMYTLDDKLLCGSPEIRIKDKLFPVDDRQKTVKKALKLFNKKSSEENEAEDFDRIDELLKLAFGKRHKEIEAMELSFSAYNELTSLVLAAMTGEDEENFKRDKEQKDQSFPESESDGAVV